MTDPFSSPTPAPVDRTVDRTVGWVLFGLLATAVIVLTGLGALWWALTGMGCASAPSPECEDTSIRGGFLVTAGGPWVVLVGALVWMIRRTRRRAGLWWVPLVGFLGAAGCFVVGLALTPGS